MLRPIEIVPSIAASTTKQFGAPIQLIRCRTLSITARTTCGASLDANPKVLLDYSPDGIVWDSDVFASFEITYSVGQPVQRTRNIDPPEHGYMRARLQNQSSADTLAASSIWYSIQAWSPDDKIEEGDIRKR